MGVPHGWAGLFAAVLGAPMLDLLRSVLERTHLALIFLGVLVVLIGASGQVPVGSGSVALKAPWNYGVSGLGMLCIVVGMALLVVEHRRGPAVPPPSTAGLFGEPLAISAYARSHRPEFYVEVERLVKNAAQVSFISMGLQILREGNILDILINRAHNRAVQVRACMANPFNPDVLDRLVEEEMFETQPQVGRRGVERNIHSLLDRLRKENYPANFHVSLFEHYPTFATYIIDRDVFLVPYVYQLLGFEAPVLHLKNDGRSEVARFFVDNAERVLRDAVPARDVLETHPDRRHFSDEWVQACISIVPDADAPIYQFGTGVIGYDLRAGIAAPVPLLESADMGESVGEVAEQGFHAPLVEPLYFMGDAAIRRLAAELTILVDEFPRFFLTNARLEDRALTSGRIAIRCDDPSGVAEALHGELVSRVYRRAVTSRYLAGHGQRQAMPGQPTGRTSLMIRRYGSPFVLSRFDVLFALYAEPPVDPAARRAVVGQLDAALREHVPVETIVVDRIELLVKRSGEARWHVHRSYRLN